MYAQLGYDAAAFIDSPFRQYVDVCYSLFTVVVAPFGHYVDVCYSLVTVVVAPFGPLGHILLALTGINTSLPPSLPTSFFLLQLSTSPVFAPLALHQLASTLDISLPRGLTHDSFLS